MIHMMRCAHFHKGHLLVVIAEGEDGKMVKGSPPVEVQVIYLTVTNHTVW